MRIDSATHSSEGRIFTLFLKITNQEAVSSTMGGFEQQNVPLPEIAYERLWAVGTKNPDFPIKNWIFRRATCSSYFRDILVWCECTYAQTCPCRILAEMKGVIHSHSDARKCAKKTKPDLKIITFQSISSAEIQHTSYLACNIHIFLGFSRI